MGQWNYGYDNLNRLTTGTAPGVQPTWVSNYFAGVASGWTYDAWGNRRSQTQGAVSGFTPQASLPASSTATFNTSNQLTATGYAMDAAGEVQADGLNHYLYDAEGRICAVQNSVGGLTGYVYDAAGIRVAKGGLTSFTCNFAASGGNGFAVNTSWTLGPGGEQIGEFAVSGTTSTWTHSNVFAAGKLLATYNTTGTYYDLTDWLGTKRVEVNAALTCETGFRSLPYGNGLSSYAPTALPQCVDATEQHYTGKERDAESGNDYFEARYYASGFGRFMSPDWSAKEEPVPYAKLDDPQTLNLYAYVRDNPLSRTDPDGHCFEDACVLEGSAVVGGGSALLMYGGAVLAGAVGLTGLAQTLHNNGDAIMSGVKSLGDKLGSMFSKKDTPAPAQLQEQMEAVPPQMSCQGTKMAGRLPRVTLRVHTLNLEQSKGARDPTLKGVSSIRVANQ